MINLLFPIEWFEEWHALDIFHIVDASKTLGWVSVQQLRITN